MKIHVVLTDKAISWIKECRKKQFLYIKNENFY